MYISPQNPIFDNLLELSHRYDSNKWSNLGFTEEITQVVPIEVFFSSFFFEILTEAAASVCLSAATALGLVENNI